MSNEGRNWSSMKNGNIWDPKQDADKKPLQATKDSYLEGVYLSKEENTGQDKNSTLYRIKAFARDGKQLAKPEITSAWGSHVLDDMMDKVAQGSYVRILWLGQKQPKQGGRPYHDWDVMVDHDYKGETVNAPANAHVAQPEATEESMDLPF